jgi:hypothetical protein
LFCCEILLATFCVNEVPCTSNTTFPHFRNACTEKPMDNELWNGPNGV